MKVVLSIGGSVLVPELAADRVRGYADAIERLMDQGWTIGIVDGGGGIARKYIETARELDANEIQLDQLGIAVTRLNARLLTAAFGGEAIPSPPEDYETAGAAMRRDGLTVMGGMAPGQTTDAVSAALAEFSEADLLVYATSVDGVFSDDPNENPAAEKYDQLTPAELVDVIAHVEMSAGSSAPVDLLAAKLIERSGMRTIVLDGTDPDRIVEAVLHGHHGGTDIIPDGGTSRLTDWLDE